MRDKTSSKNFSNGTTWKTKRLKESRKKNLQFLQCVLQTTAKNSRVSRKLKIQALRSYALGEKLLLHKGST